MSAFVDSVLLELSDPAKLEALIAPSTDPNQTILKALFGAVYDLPFGQLDSVKSSQVVATEFARPIFPAHRTIGTWLQTMPAQSRTEVTYEGSNGMTPEWIDCLAQLQLTVVLNIDPGEVESLLFHALPDFTSIAQFKSNFQFFDVDTFMAEHGLKTVDDLKEAFDYLVGEIRLKAPQPFSPADPANEYPFPLQVAFLVRDTIDVNGSLRDAKLARTLIEHTLAYQRSLDQADVRTPYAPVLVFPANALPSGLTAAALQTFFAQEHVQVLLAAP